MSDSQPATSGRPAEHGILSQYIPADEPIRFRAKPHPLFIVLEPLGKIAALIVVSAGVWWFFGRVGLPEWQAGTLATCAIVLVLTLVWSSLVWLCRLYVLTDERVIRVSGVLRQSVADVPLHRIQHAVVYRSVRERIFGLGTIGFATPGTGGIEAAWVMLPSPDTVLAMVRKHTPSSSIDHASDRPLVIGLAGGIGAGKSHVARVFEKLGCVVVDSDARARAVLEQDEVKQTLVKWWGESVLDEQGRISRSVVASIVFNDPEQRERLEGLIHPRLREGRERAIQSAGQSGAPAVIIDAPLLFEAGVDAECDLVIFVDAPRIVRLERVMRTRGWSEDELARRESAQLPVEEKQRRADVSVDSTEDASELEAQVLRILSQARKMPARGTNK